MLADAEVRFALQAEDEYSSVLAGLQADIDGLSGADINIGVTADTTEIDEVQNEIAELDGSTASFTVSADDQATDILDQIQAKLDELSISAGDVGGLLTAGLAGGVGGAVAGAGGDILGGLISGITDMPGKAAQAETAQKRLELTVQAGGVVWSSVKDKTLEYIEALMKVTAIDDEKIMDTASTLMLMGMNYDTAMASLATTLDLATAKQMDEVSAANLVGKAWLGNYSILQRYGIVIDDATKKSGDWAKVLESLTAKFGGFANNMADTFQGSMDRMGNAWENFQEWVGGGLNWILGGAANVVNSLTGQTGVTSTVISAPSAGTGIKSSSLATTPDLSTTSRGIEVIAKAVTEPIVAAVTKVVTPTTTTTPALPWYMGGSLPERFTMQEGGIVHPWYFGSGSGVPVTVAEKEPEVIAPLSELERMIKTWVNQPTGQGDFFPTGPTRGELYPSQKTEVTFNINVRGATTTDLQFANEVARQLSQLNALKSSGRQIWT